MKKRMIFILALFMMTMVSEKSFANQAILSWDKNSEADLAGYRIYYGTMSGTYAKIIDVGLTATPATPSYTIYGLTPGNTYYFVATAYDTAGNESAYSNEIFKIITADLITPGDVLGLTVAVFQTGVRLSWINPPDTDLTGLILQYTWNGGPLTHIANLRAVPGAPQTYDHLNLMPGTYSYAMHTKDSSGNITNTAHAKITIASASSVDPRGISSPPPADNVASSGEGGGGGCGITQKKESGIDPTFPLIVLSFALWNWKLTRFQSKIKNKTPVSV